MGQRNPLDEKFDGKGDFNTLVNLATLRAQGVDNAGESNARSIA
jgi:hypothetical protein